MAKKKPTSKEPKNKAPGAVSGPMDVRLLEQMVKLMAANDLSTIEVRDGDKRVLLSRGGEVQYAPRTISQPQQVTSAIANTPASSTLVAAADSTSNLVQIKSPMVGTFYSAGSPDSKAFVSVGSTVDEETDVCIIEAMKVFNNIKAECRGTIAKIVVSNGQTVEFGQTLFLVTPA